MYINCKFLLSVVFLLSLVLPAFSFEPSGGVLMLDGEDDYAILPLAEHGYIFPRNTDAFTAEVWFYPKSKPEEGEKDIILRQQDDLPAEEGFSPFEPPHRFVSDVHTLALWDFNDKAGAARFEDESGNGKTLISMNGAAVVGGTGVNLEHDPEDGFEIRPNTSLATTWSQVKSGSF